MILTRKEYRAIIERLGLSQAATGELLGYTILTGRRWAAVGVTGAAAILLKLLDLGVITTQHIHLARIGKTAASDKALLAKRGGRKRPARMQRRA